MRCAFSRHLPAALNAAAVAVLVLSGCATGESGSASSAPPPPAPAVARSAPVRPLPPPEALTDVLYRLADPAIPGAQKLNLVEGATPASAPVLDSFATALRDGGYVPVIFVARDLVWSDRHPADVVATVDIGTPAPGVPMFTFPMEFKPRQGGWQLSQQTANMLLAVKTAAPAPPPTP
jgi:hypothetical protein